MLSHCFLSRRFLSGLFPARLFLLIVTLISSLFIKVSLADDKPFGERSTHGRLNTIERLKPVARVCIEGMECAQANAVSTRTQVAEEAKVSLTPESIYNSKCLSCHTTGAAGAPKIGDASAWQARLDAKGIDGLTASAIAGIGAMPAMGLCMECSDEDIKATIEYIMSKTL